MGEAVRSLSEKGYRVILKYKSTADPRGEETSIIRELRKEFRLLNDEKGFDYRATDESTQRARVQEFVRILTD